MSYRRYYELLGLDESATLEQIRQAYRRRARAVHPDLNPGDPEAVARQRELNEAYAALTARWRSGGPRQTRSAVGTPARGEPAASPWPFQVRAAQRQVPPWAPFARAAAPSAAGVASLLDALLADVERELWAWCSRSWSAEVLDEAAELLAAMAWWQPRRRW